MSESESEKTEREEGMQIHKHAEYNPVCCIHFLIISYGYASKNDREPYANSKQSANQNILFNLRIMLCI